MELPRLSGTTRSPLSRRAPGALAALLLSLAVAASASAAEVGRFFAHQEIYDKGFGVAENAEEAQSFGVPMFENERIFYAGSPEAVQASGGIDVAGTARLFSLGSFDFDVLLSDVDAAAGSAHADYSVTLPAAFLAERQSDSELVYLFFASTLDGMLADYASSDVGIVIDSKDPGFGMIHTNDPSEEVDLFYPAIRLPKGGIGDTFGLDINVLGGLQVVSGDNVVPDFLVGAAYVSVIPEPATAALLALGVGWLAWLGARRYSV